MIADSHFRMTPDLRENNGWPICLTHRNPQAPFCPIMSKLVLELWSCYHLSFLCCVKQRYQILTKNSLLWVLLLLHRDEVEAGLPDAVLLLILFSLQRKPSISAWSRHFSSEPRLAQELLIGYGGFHYCATHLKLGQLGRDWRALLFISCGK